MERGRGKGGASLNFWNLLFIYSDYDNICTILNQMVREDWMGVMGNMASQVIAMFASVGVDATSCPFQPGTVDIQNYKIQLPAVASTLAWFAEVST